jgi:DNA-binding transcriptional LysR family regulator
VIEPVLQKTCQIGIVGSLPAIPEGMHSESLLDVPLVTVVAPAHPLAKYKGVVPHSELQKHVQLVLSDRSTLSKNQSYGVFSKNIWRLADMGARHAFLRAGFGFGNMPRFMVEDDLAGGKLRLIRIQMPSNSKPVMPMRAVYRSDSPPGPAGRWLVEQLKGRSQATRNDQSGCDAQGTSRSVRCV